MNKYKKIYILCPAKTKTGGTELLHQLADTLYEINADTYIVYVADNESDCSIEANEAFQKYMRNKPLVLQDIDDSKDNILVIPEIYYKYTTRFNKIYKCLWWLSVDFFLQDNSFKDRLRLNGFPSALKNFLLGRLHNKMNYIKNVDMHLCQSYYAMDFLYNSGVDRNMIKYLSDYINEEYINVTKEEHDSTKKDYVLYNPKKGLKFTKKLIKAAKDIKWIPIENMSNDQVKNLMRESKVYVDFGNHPGKDRIPREAAISGCCVITGKKGSAAFKEDVPILDKYKFENNTLQVNNIIGCIRNCLESYDESSRDFTEYRTFIKQEKEIFYKDVFEIFGKN